MVYFCLKKDLVPDTAAMAVMEIMVIMAVMEDMAAMAAMAVMVDTVPVLAMAMEMVAVTVATDMITTATNTAGK